jgi:hypothetical protein
MCWHASAASSTERPLPGEVIVRVDAQVDGAALRRVLDALRRR